MGIANPDAERTLRIGEADIVGFQFYGDDLPTGVTLSSGTVAASPAAGLTLPGGAAATLTGDAKGLYAWVTAVTAGEYDVTFTAVFSDAKTLIRIYRVTVI